MYRRTRKYDAERQRRAQATRERNRLGRPAPAYTAALPEGLGCDKENYANN